jgi:5-methylthioadenosine/S-adenosylhomocysteine deaminase
MLNEHFDSIIRCGHMLNPGANGKSTCIERVALGIRAGKIAAQDSWDNSKAWTAAELVEAPNGLLLPGFVNAHTHLPMSLFRGLADDLPFQEWLFQYIVPLEGRLVSPEFVKLGTELSCLEAIRFGVTTVCDMYYYMAEIAEVLDSAGMRAVVSQHLWDWPAPDDKSQQGLEKVFLQNLVDKYSKHDRIVAAAGPHAPYSCGDDLLKWTKDFCDKHNVPFHIHVSETKKEVHDSVQQFGMSPVQRLAKLGVLESHAVFAHCVHLDAKDIQSIASSKKVGVIHNPESNMKLGSGIAPVRQLLDAGACVGLGTDGVASNNDLGLFKEMDVAAKLQKLAHNDNTALTAEQAFYMATLGSAKALGLDHKVGSIEVGKAADLVIADLNAAHLYPQHSMASLVVYSMSGLEVQDVWIQGKRVFKNSSHTTLSFDACKDRVDFYRRQMKF